MTSYADTLESFLQSLKNPIGIILPSLIFIFLVPSVLNKTNLVLDMGPLGSNGDSRTYLVMPADQEQEGVHIGPEVGELHRTVLKGRVAAQISGEKLAGNEYLLKKTDEWFAPIVVVINGHEAGGIKLEGLEFSDEVRVDGFGRGYLVRATIQNWTAFANSIMWWVNTPLLLLGIFGAVEAVKKAVKWLKCPRENPGDALQAEPNSNDKDNRDIGVK
ncbi:MAG: hypothetical protein ABW168_29845 [Sedimenticola sp.]